MNETVLVTGVGGNVGQGVLRLLRAIEPGLRLVGTNTEFVSGGNHLCDAVHLVPGGVDSAYPDEMRRICSEEQVSLVLPCTDAETVFLARHRESLPTVAVSPEATCAVFFDKWETARRFSRLGIPFAASWLPSTWDGHRPCIVKPREGRGSRGLVLQPTDPRSYSDDQIVQERLEGPEITVAFYVDLAGTLHAFLVMRRDIQGGATMRCETVSEYDDRVSTIVRQMVEAFEIRGCCNFQAIVTGSGDVVPFEVNCRISGTASIRHHFGFRDVEWTLGERLRSRAPERARTISGSAVRLLMDVIYPDMPLDAARDRRTRNIVF